MSGESGDVAVRINADPGTEFVVSGTDRVKICSGVGSRTIRLPKGIYKARFLAGARSSDVLFEVGEGENTVSAPLLEFASAIPLNGTTNSHEYHQAAAGRLRGLTPSARGTGATISLLARDSAKQWGEGPPSEPWAGLELKALDGRAMADFSSDGERDGERGYVAARIALDPGTYLLIMKRESGPELQLPLTASADWETTVFLDCAGPPGAREADLYGASIVIAKSDAEFFPDDPALRLGELAKSSIQKARVAVDAEKLSEMMERKFTYPMLGILAAHVMLLAKEPDVSKLKVVINNLCSLLPDHSDVIALRVALGRLLHDERVAELRVSGPPMLRNSWDILLAASAQYPRLFPGDASWLDFTASLTGSRVWLVWQAPANIAKDDFSVVTSAISGMAARIDLRAMSRAMSSSPDQEMAIEKLVAGVMEEAQNLLAVKDGAIDLRRLAAIWSAVRRGLEDPSIATSPLQSALRRKILLIIQDVEEDPALAMMLESLVKDLRVPARTLVSAAASLYAAAKRQEGALDDSSRLIRAELREPPAAGLDR